MAGISFMNRNDVGSVVVEGGEPFLFLFLRPIVLRRRDVVIGLGSPLLEWTRRIHRCKGRGAQILRRLFDLCANLRGDADQMTVQNVLADLVQVFGDIGKEFVRRRMFALVLFENVEWPLVRVLFLRTLRKRVLAGLALRAADPAHLLMWYIRPSAL